MNMNKLTSSKKQKDLWDSLSNETKKSIERGLKDIEMGKVTPHKEVMKKYKKWLS